MKTLALLLVMASTAFAIEQPPTEPAQQRQWLADHVVADMQSLGVFRDKDFRKVPRLIEELNDEEVALVTQFYYLTRAKAEQDAGVYAQQQQGVPLDQARAPVADLLGYMQTETATCYSQCGFAPYLAQVVYASVPGWCLGQQICVPEPYYDNGYYVGGCYDYGYAGRWAQPVCGAYYDTGSSFYLNYNKNKVVFRDHAIYNARHSADWFRHHDWHQDLHHNHYGQHGNHVAPYHANGNHVAHNGGQHGRQWKQNGGQHNGNGQRLAQHSAPRPQQFARPQHSTNPRPQQFAQRQHSAPRPQQFHSAPRPQQHAAPRPQQFAQRQHAAPRPQQFHSAPRPQQHAAPRAQSHAAPRPQQHAAPRAQSHAAPRSSGGGGHSGGHGGGRGHR